MSKNGSMTPQKPKSLPQPLVAFGPAFWPLLGLGTLILFFYLFHPILMPFVVALVMAYILDPPVGFLVKRGLSRTVATSLMVLSVLALLTTFFFFAIPFLKNEIQAFSGAFPVYLSTLTTHGLPKIKALTQWVSQTIPGSIFGDFTTTWLVHWDEKIQSTISENLSKMASWVMTLIAGIFANSLALVNLVSLVFLTPFLIFYLLRDWPRILTFLENLVPPHQKKSTRQLGKDINTTLSAYFRGQAALCTLMAIYYVLALSVLNLNYAFTIGLVSGFLTFIPYVGFLTGLLAAVAVALAQFGDLPSFLMVLSIYTAGHLSEAFFLTPRLVGDKVGLHPVWVIFALLGGGVLLGFTGLFLAVPVAAIIAVVLRFILGKYHDQVKKTGAK